MTAYGWDTRGRLTSVKIYNSFDDYNNNITTPDRTITYTYDMFNNLIGRTDSGAGSQSFVFDGQNMVLAFNGNDLTDRYLYGPAVDQVLADENFNGSIPLPNAAGTTLWTLGDNQNSVTDLVSDAGAVLEHIDYSPFGLPTVTPKGTLPANYSLPLGYTGTYTDPVTGLAT